MKRGLKESSPAAFLLALLSPGSHLGSEELIQAVLLPALAGWRGESNPKRASGLNLY